MKKSAVFILAIAGVLSIFLSGCQTRVESDGGTLENVSGTSVVTGEVTKEEDTADERDTRWAGWSRGKGAARGVY